MKKPIFETWDSNMAGQEWRWVFSLEKCANDTFTLSGKQTLVEPEYDEESFEIEPVSGLRRGTDIYEQFQMMLSEAGEDIQDLDLDAIADAFIEFDPKAAHHFRRGEELLERHAEWGQRRRQRVDTKKLAPFRDKIDAYCANLDDSRPTRRPSERTRVRAFLEGYVRRFRETPTGLHTWNMGGGWGSGSHDFGDLPNE